jgi:hypothetical protein
MDSYGVQLYLVFEFLDLDLKKYMDQLPADGTGLGPDMVKKFTLQLISGTYPSVLLAFHSWEKAFYGVIHIEFFIAT